MPHRDEQYPYDSKGRLKNDPGSPEAPDNLAPNREVRGDGSEGADNQSAPSEPEEDQETVAPQEEEPTGPEPDREAPEPAVGGRPATEEEAQNAGQGISEWLEQAARSVQDHMGGTEPEDDPEPQTPPQGDQEETHETPEWMVGRSSEPEQLNEQQEAERQRLQDRADDLREEGKTGRADQIEGNIEERFGGAESGSGQESEPESPEPDFGTDFTGPARPDTRELPEPEANDEIRRDMGEIKGMLQKLIQMQPNDRKDTWATFE